MFWFSTSCRVLALGVSTESHATKKRILGQEPACHFLMAGNDCASDGWYSTIGEWHKDSSISLWHTEPCHILCVPYIRVCAYVCVYMCIRTHIYIHTYVSVYIISMPYFFWKTKDELIYIIILYLISIHVKMWRVVKIWL